LSELLKATLEHLYLTVVSLTLSVIIGVTIGTFIARHRRVASVVIAVAGVIYTIPSLALFGLLVPLLGLGVKPTIVGLVLYSQLMIIRNTYVGINSVDPSVLDASRGMGMTRFEILRMVELPLALPVIIAGIKNIAVMTIGVAAVAAVIGAGGLGMFVYNGINRRIMGLVLTGVLIMSILSIASETLLHRFEITLTPEHKRR
jgi:osmoprotectant transport system permease protein